MREREGEGGREGREREREGEGGREGRERQRYRERERERERERGGGGRGTLFFSITFVPAICALRIS